MARNKRNQLWVWLDDTEYGGLQKIGVLSRGSRGAVSFSYDKGWLDHAQTFPLDPELDLYPGDFYPQDSNFGIFMDSCPDRWGQSLMKRREAVNARDEKRRPQSLDAWDFLLGVQDCTRMGALRFSLLGEEDFLANEALSAPPLTSLAELEAVAFELSKEKHDDLKQVKQWLKVLVAPGSSLGGARPKANIVDKQGQLWIAKFPAVNDSYDVALWEKVLHAMAYDCGIKVPGSKVKKLSGGYHTFLVERFDRKKNKRIFFTSAMARLNHSDGEEASYLEMAEFLSTQGDPDYIKDDLQELFKRVVFNVATANRDDHLRNHGFFRGVQGWRLAPAFDMNPSFDKIDHALALDLNNHHPDLRIVLETSNFYGLSQRDAEDIIEDICSVVSSWERRATQMGIGRLACLEAAHLFVVSSPLEDVGFSPR